MAGPHPPHRPCKNMGDPHRSDFTTAS